MPEEKKEELIHLTIDDMPVEVPPGTLVWAAAKQAGIEIPISVTIQNAAIGSLSYVFCRRLRRYQSLPKHLVRHLA